MEVTVKLFAMFREAAGSGELRWEVPEGATVSELWRELQATYPNLPRVRPAVAINAEYVKLDATLQAGDEVAFLPPVSGGGFVRWESGGCEYWKTRDNE
jgi:molybdopterin synthase catalytic subunit